MSTSQSNSDLQLLRRYVDRDDRAALDELFGRHYPAVHRTILKLVHDESDANDIAQSTFLAALRAGHSAPPKHSFRAWLLKIAVNEVRRFRRDERRRAPDWLFGVYLEADPSRGTADSASHREFERALEDALEQIPQPLKEPLVLHYYEDLPLAAVGEVLGVSKSTVQSRVERAVRRLRREFRRRGHLALLPVLELELALPAAAPAGASLAARVTAGVLSMKAKSLLLAIAIAVAAVWIASRSHEGPGPLLDSGVRTGGPVTSADPTTGSGPEVGAEPIDEAGRVAVTPGVPRVFGRVVDVSDVPLAGAALSLFDYEGTRVLTTSSGDDGRYEFADTLDHGGLFHLVVEKPGYGRRTAPEVRASHEPRRDVLDPGLVILGRVVAGPGGEAVTRFRVHAVRLSFQTAAEWNPIAALVRQAIPESLAIDRSVDVEHADGKFRIEGLAAGRFALIVAAPGRQPAFFNGGGRSWDRHLGVDARTADEADEVLIELPATGTAWVEAIDRATGRPALGATVSATVDVGRTRFAIAAPCSSGADHRIRVPVDLGPRGKIRDFDFIVSAPGYAPVERSTSGHADGHTFQVALGRPAAIRGTVRDEGGAPVAGAAILIERGYDQALVGSAHTDVAGAYEITSLDALGATTLRCFDASLRTVLATAALQLVDGRTSIVDIGGVSAASIGGIVRLHGEPQRHATVHVTGVERGADVCCETSDDGRFAFYHLAPDRYELVVTTAFEGRTVWTERIVDLTVGGSRRVDVDFNRTIAGTAVDAATGEPIEGADDNEFDVVARPLGVPGHVERTWIDDGGRFRLLVAGPGTYEITIENAERWVIATPARGDLTNAEHAEVELRVAKDPGGGTIALRIVDAASGAPVVTGSLRHAHGTVRGAAVFERGEFTVEEAAPGVHRFTVSSDEHRPARFEVEVSPLVRTVERTVALEPATTVVVAAATPGGPAYRAGVRAGDVLVRFGDVDVRSVAGLRAAIADAAGPVQLVVERDGIQLTFGVGRGRLGIEAENAR